MKNKIAFIFGIGGQDGSYLAELLLEKNYVVHGLVRRSSIGNTNNIKHIESELSLHYGDLSESVSLFNLIQKVNPDEIYNEADQDHAGISFDIPSYNFDITGSAVGRILEIIRLVNNKIKFFQPISSNIFGKAESFPQNEDSSINPQNPYACSKVFAWTLCKMYRNVYNMFVSVGIFYNHESPRRKNEYVTRKITQSVARIKLGKQDSLTLGDISSHIDWGYAKEYMMAAYDIMQLSSPDDFVLGSGKTHSVEDFVNETFRLADLNPKSYLKTNSSLYRPGDNSVLVADTTKAKEIFGFEPKSSFNDLVKMMYENDLKIESRL